MSMQPKDPEARKQFQQEQAARIGLFLSRLADDDSLLLAYLNDPVAALKDEMTNGNLILEDVALLLEGSYCRVSEVMSQGAQGFSWHMVWHF
jgi:hypothetical protein